MIKNLVNNELTIRNMSEGEVYLHAIDTGYADAIILQRQNNNLYFTYLYINSDSTGFYIEDKGTFVTEINKQVTTQTGKTFKVNEKDTTKEYFYLTYLELEDEQELIGEFLDISNCTEFITSVKNWATTHNISITQR